MLYNRTVYDLASIVKLVVDKISVVDRYQVLALLKNIQRYLETCDVTGLAAFDDPLTTVCNLIHNIEDVNSVEQSVHGAPKHSSPRKLQADRPSVSRVAAVKRPPPDFQDDGQDGDDNGMDMDMGASISCGDEQLVQEEVIGQETDWQPVHVLERALTAIAADQGKTTYVFEGTPDVPFESDTKAVIGKTKRGRNTKSNEQKLYFPENVEFCNPTPRIVAKEGDRKWPENARWICVYCRLITKNLHNYKTHLRFIHRTESPCCCRFCRRELPNLELLNFHLCREKHQCHVCLKTFNRPHKLRRHMGTHFKSVMVLVTCKLCQLKFSSVSQCAIHVYDEHEIVINCDSCVTEMDPHEVTPKSANRVYCKKCLESSKSEPESVPLNPNSDIDITTTSLNVYDKGEEASSSSTPRSALHHCDACDEDVMGGQFMWNKHLMLARHIKAAAAKSGEACPGFTCDDCGKVFVSEERLSKHMLVHGGDGATKSKVYTCKRCGKQLLTRGGFRNHIASHLGERNFTCKDCGKRFFSSSTLCDHRNSLHRPDLKFACSWCGEEFTDRKRRTRHINIYHHNFVYKCPGCTEMFRSGNQLKAHMEAVHPDIKWTQPIHYRQRSEQPMAKRKKSSAMQEGKTFSWTCDVCEVEIKTVLGKERHLSSATHLTNQAHHNGTEATSYECHECGRKFLSLRYLESHIERNHNVNGRKYPCDECEKIFLTPSGLRSHKIKHTGIRDFVCSLCGMAFFTKPGLSDHIASVHGGTSKEYPCKQCGKVFKDRKLRTKHIDKEHHNYVFRCPCCEFVDKSGPNLKRHIRQNHPEEVWTRPADYRYDEGCEGQKEISMHEIEIGELVEEEPASQLPAEETGN